MKHINNYTKHIKDFFPEDTRTLEEKSLATLKRIAEKYFDNDVQEALLTLFEYCENNRFL